MNPKPKPKSSKKAAVKIPRNEQVPKREALRLDAEFYQAHYIRGLRYITGLVILNAVMISYAWILLRHHYTADVYAATIEGKLYALNEVPPPIPVKANNNAALPSQTPPTATPGTEVNQSSNPPQASPAPTPNVAAPTTPTAPAPAPSPAAPTPTTAAAPVPTTAAPLSGVPSASTTTAPTSPSP